MCGGVPCGRRALHGRAFMSLVRRVCGGSAHGVQQPSDCANHPPQPDVSDGRTSHGEALMYPAAWRPWPLSFQSQHASLWLWLSAAAGTYSKASAAASTLRRCIYIVATARVNTGSAAETACADV